MRHVRTKEKPQPKRKVKNPPQPMDLNMHQPAPHFAWAGPGHYVYSSPRQITLVQCTRWAGTTPLASAGYFGAQPATFSGR